MKQPAEPSLEADSLEALKPFQILDNAPEEVFDELTRLAAEICAAPMAVISFAVKEDLWLKSRLGLDLAEVRREGTICDRALWAADLVIVEDLAAEPRHFESARQKLGREIGFYAGVPLRPRPSAEPGAPPGTPVGVLCVMDSKPRSLSPAQQQSLRTLARQVEAQLELRRSLWEVRQKQLELQLALQHSEGFYHSLVETIPQNIFRKDLHGRFTFANSRFCEAVKRLPSEVIGKTDFDLFPPELAAKYQSDDRTVIETGATLKGIERHSGADGRTLYVQVIKAPLRGPSGEITGVQGIFWDETDRHNAEEQLAHERDLLRAMLENLPDNIYFKDRESRFIAISRALANQFGLIDPAEAQGKTDADFFDASHAEEALADERQILRTGQPIIAKTEREVRGDGKTSWVLTTKVPLVSPNGEIRGTFGISKDITEIKAAQEELASARDAALESARIKSEFLANMSHEIRTPLNAVIGMTGLLLETRLDQEQRDFAETIRNSADALLGIINDILDFSKIEAGRMAIETVDFDLSEVVEGTLELLAESAQAKGIELASWIPDGVPRFLRGDPGRIRQVLTNLVGNAVKFTEKGEVIVNLSLARETDHHAELRFSVRDTGVGVPHEARARLFQAFTQADGSTTRKYGGTGLGLAISRQLVELMRGEIGFESEEGRGSTFWFSLPLEKQPQPPPMPMMSSTLDGARAIVIDDNETNRQIVHHQLAAWRMRNGGAGSGLDGLAMLRQAALQGDPYQLAIIDMQMPEMDGLALARAIKADPAIASTRIIMLTSLGNLPEERRWRETGISAYLIKPVKEARLYDTLVSVMRGSIGPSGRSVPGAQREEPGQRSVRILVAEDNVVNQKVALRQIQKLGYSADAVANGLEVLDAIKTVPYDIILMDCQMPELDGYETTRLIRSEEHSRRGDAHRLYVVAMTANALDGDREECLTAGMDDYISKPVRIDELGAAIERGLQFVRQSRDNEALLDPEMLQAVRELANPGEPDPLAELIDLFLQDTPQRLSRILDAFKAGDCAEIERAAHSLKGSASNLGARSLAAACNEILKPARDGRLPESSAVARVISEFDRLKPALEREKQA